METDGIDAKQSMWDLMWERAKLPDGLIDEWRAVMAYRTTIPDDAEILAAYDWTPGQVVAARTDASLYWPDADKDWPSQLRDDPAADGDAGRRRAALMVLAEETARYHDSCSRLAREARTQYVLDLAQRLPKEARWSHELIGVVLSLTKQRVQQIIRNAKKYSHSVPDPEIPASYGRATVEVVTEARRRRLDALLGRTLADE